MQELLLGHLSHWMQTLLSLSTEQRLSRHTRTAQYAGRLWAHADTASHKAGYTLRLSGAREAHVSAGRSRPRPDDRTGTHTLHTSTRVWPKPPHHSPAHDAPLPSSGLSCVAADVRHAAFTAAAASPSDGRGPVHFQSARQPNAALSLFLRQPVPRRPRPPAPLTLPKLQGHAFFSPELSACAHPLRLRAQASHSTIGTHRRCRPSPSPRCLHTSRPARAQSNSVAWSQASRVW